MNDDLHIGDWAWRHWPVAGIYEVIAIDDDNLTTWRITEGWPLTQRLGRES